MNIDNELYSVESYAEMIQQTGISITPQTLREMLENNELEHIQPVGTRSKFIYNNSHNHEVIFTSKIAIRNLPVVQLKAGTLDLVNTFGNMDEASEKTKISRNSIRRCLYGYYKKASGYVFMTEYAWKKSKADSN